MNDYGKLRVVRGEPILAKGCNSKEPLSEILPLNELENNITFLIPIQTTLPTAYIESSLVSTQYFSWFGIKPIQATVKLPHKGRTI